MDPTKIESREVAGRSLMMHGEDPALIEFKMEPPEDDGPIGPEIRAAFGFTMENPAEMLEEVLARQDLDGMPEEYRDAMEAMAEHMRERVAEMGDEIFSALPYHACGSPVFTLSMN